MRWPARLAGAAAVCRTEVVPIHCMSLHVAGVSFWLLPWKRRCPMCLFFLTSRAGATGTHLSPANRTSCACAICWSAANWPIASWSASMLCGRPKACNAKRAAWSIPPGSQRRDPPELKRRARFREAPAQAGHPWELGLQTHIGVNADSGRARTVRGSRGNAAGVSEAGSVLHGQEADVFGDAGHQGADTRSEVKPEGRGQALDKARLVDARLERLGKSKGRIRAKAERPLSGGSSGGSDLAFPAIWFGRL